MARKQKPTVVELLADLADAHAMWAVDVIKRPELLRKGGLKPSQVDDTMASRADHLNHERSQKLIARYTRTQSDNSSEKKLEPTHHFSIGSTGMQASREEVNELFVELGFATVDKWSEKRVQGKIAKLPELVGDDVEVSNTELLEGILGAIENDEEIELMAGDAEQEEEEEKPKRRGSRKTTTAGGKGKRTTGGSKAKSDDNGAAKTTKKGPGVIASIEELLRKATSRRPITKDKIVEALAKRFPERDPDAMRKTVNVQVGSRIEKEKGLTLEKNDKGGFWAK